MSLKCATGQQKTAKDENDKNKIRRTILEVVLPLTIFIYQMVRSWVTIFHLQPPMTFTFDCLYDIKENAPLTNVSFCGPRNFQVSFSNRNM